jgi:HAE1 family hydrophobic/amphiphilic exporter-1
VLNFPTASGTWLWSCGGFELRLLDKTGSGDYKKMEAINNDFVKELNKRRELSNV